MSLGPSRNPPLGPFSFGRRLLIAVSIIAIARSCYPRRLVAHARKAAAETIEGNSDRHSTLLTLPIGSPMRKCAGVSWAKVDWQGNTPFLASHRGARS
jgi:hypothetical protein